LQFTQIQSQEDLLLQLVQFKLRAALEETQERHLEYLLPLEVLVVVAALEAVGFILLQGLFLELQQLTLSTFLAEMAVMAGLGEVGHLVAQLVVMVEMAEQAVGLQ
jgi:hypothetical protein